MFNITIFPFIELIIILNYFFCQFFFIKMFIIKLLMSITIREYISFKNPKLNDPINIIVELTIKFVIGIFIFKYVWSKVFIIDIPPWLKFNLYIIPPVIPQIIPAIIDDINGILIIMDIDKLFVNFIKNGYVREAIIKDNVVSFFKKI